MKKPLLLAVNLLMMTSLLGDCTLTKVEKEVIPTSGYSEDRECSIRTGSTVFITYYEENGKNIVTKISTDNDEKEIVVYVSSGEIEEIMEETIKVHVSEGDNNGESIVFDTSEASIPQEASVNSTVTVTYYLKENTYYALSVSCTEHLASLLDIPSWIVYYIKEV